MSSNSAAKELLNYAKSRLHKFYSPKLYKASPKEQASEEDSAALLVQITEHQNVVASKPAPATWTGSYQKSGENKSVISMIDLLMKELDMEITEAQAEEKNAQKEYETVMDDAAEKRAADLKSIAQKERAKAEAVRTRLQLLNLQRQRPKSYRQRRCTKCSSIRSATGSSRTLICANKPAARRWTI